MEKKTDINKEEMSHISIGIAKEMSDDDFAERIGDNGKTGDQKVVIWQIRGVRVASTNGGPVWEQADEAAFAELLESEGVAL